MYVSSLALIPWEQMCGTFTSGNVEIEHLHLVTFAEGEN